MAATLSIDAAVAQRFVLVLARVAGVVGLAPVLGGGNVPRAVKAGLALSMTVLLAPRAALPTFHGGLPELTVAIGGEVLVGALVAFVIVAMFAVVQLAGQSIGIQMGFAAASQFDPASQSNSVVVAQFQFIVATLLFFALDGHHRAIEALAVSFSRVPLLHAQLSGGVMSLIVAVTAGVFVAAISIAAPVIAAMLLTNLGLGILARTLPQMNVFMVAFPLQITVGLLGLGITLPLLAWWMGHGVGDLSEQFGYLLRHLVAS
ncbi:MAG: flagellar biosynthetic protein FliR [Nitrospirota bacterium]|jgi:flagellar biosynthetic protein FliR